VDKLGAEGILVDWGVELTRLEQDDACVRVVMQNRGVEETGEFSFVCGCDGVHSRVREELGIGFPGGTYEHLFYVADVKAEGPFEREGFANFEARVFGLMLPVRSRGMQRLIGIVPDELAARPDLRFEDIRGIVEPLLGVRVAELNWFSTYRVHHRVADHFQLERCFLAGDAGHVHSPVGGQGMNTGIGDAVNLAWKLADVVRGRAPRAILETYEPERIAFARTLVATTDRAFQGIVRPAGGSRFARTWLLPRLLSIVLGASRTARRALFEIASQVRIQYRGSALSEGAAGHVHGGDRLPWVPLADGDNFAPLTARDWQLHVYGELRPEMRRAADAQGLPYSVFAWTDVTGRAGLQRDALYLVRPDGYVALASEAQDPARLEAYTQRLDLRIAGRHEA
jgi:2-polyprenyl-6-methoxyphenol hydroxylase-like FAD-dependent oxidoreductase